MPLSLGLSMGLQSVVQAVGSFLPTSPQAIQFGDSRLALSRSRADPAWITGTQISKYGRGIDNWSEFLSYGRVEFPSAMNFAVSGDSIAEQLVDIQAELDGAVTAGGGFIVWLCGVNGIRAGDTEAQTLADAASAIALFKATGLPIVVIADWPAFNGGDFPDTTQAIWDVHLALRSYYLGLASDPQIDVIDGWSIVGPIGAAPALPSIAQQAYFEDAYLHLQTGGAYAIASAMQPIFERWYPNLPAMPASDVIFPDLGNSGGLTSGGVMGSEPSGFTVTASNITGLVAVGSVSTITVDGVTSDAQQINVTGTAPASGGQSFIRALENTSLGATGARTYELYADVEIDRAVGVEAIDLAIQIGFGGGGASYTLAWFNADDVFPGGPIKGRYRSLPFEFADGETAAMRWRVLMKNGATVDCTARIGNLALVEVS